MNLLATTVALTLAVSAATAQAAALYDFSYVSAAGTLSGQLAGSLQADNNRVVIDHFVDFAAWNGTPGPTLTYVNSLEGYYLTHSVEPGVVSRDGAVMDFIVCNDAAYLEGFLFDSLGIVLGYPFFATSDAFGRAFDGYDPAGWSLTAVPEPANWALMVAGFGLVGAVLRRRVSTATASPRPCAGSRRSWR